MPNPAAAVARLPKGAAVLLRDYDHPERTNLAYCLARICRRRGLRLLVAGDVRLARRLRADGVHYSEAAMRRGPRFANLRPKIVTTACHDRISLYRAAALGADACLLSPVFPTDSHPGATALGVRRFALLARGLRLPVYALGGINARTVRRLTGTGACGIAAIGAFRQMAPTGRRISELGGKCYKAAP